eukprot:9406973-Prorocentrum_lima.AAC.1
MDDDQAKQTKRQQAMVFCASLAKKVKLPTGLAAEPQTGGQKGLSWQRLKETLLENPLSWQDNAVPILFGQEH